MFECPLLRTCSFFNDQMAGMPATAASMKQRYCQGDNTRCARYQVFQAVGRAKVPPQLLPSQAHKVNAIIAAG
jgi:hypothetical protein